MKEKSNFQPTGTGPFEMNGYLEISTCGNENKIPFSVLQIHMCLEVTSVLTVLNFSFDFSIYAIQLNSIIAELYKSLYLCFISRYGIKTKKMEDHSG